MEKIICQRITFFFIAIFSLAISGCNAGPDYVRPPVAIPAQFKETPKVWIIAKPQDNLDRGQWWSIFNDPQLNALEEKVNISNQNIVQAAAQYRQASALVDEARASYFPTIAASAALTRQKQSSSSNFNTSTNNTATVGTSASHALNLDATWAPDLWGSVSRSVEASKANAQAAAAKLALIKLSQQAALAQFYFELRALDTDQKLLDDTVIDDQKALQITKNRYQSGVAGLADIVQAETQLEAAQALAINNGINRAQYAHAIAILIGQPPENFSWSSQPLADIPPPEVPLLIPSTLLQRRPDVAQAEREVAQANAEIGVAISAYFPTLTLSASGSMMGNGLGPWFSLPTLSWAVGPTLAETLFDGGLRSATTAAARANYEATVANYRQTTLAAFQNVEDNLASVRILAMQSSVQNKAAADARLALKLVMNNYKAGTAAYSDVIAAQIIAFSDEKAAADTNGLRMTATVELIEALGGGWDANCDKNMTNWD